MLREIFFNKMYMLALGGYIFNSVRRRTLTMMETHLQYKFLDEYQKKSLLLYSFFFFSLIQFTT